MFQSYHVFMFQLHHSNHKNVTHIIPKENHSKINVRMHTRMLRKLNSRFALGHRYGQHRLFPSEWLVSQYRHNIFAHIKRLTGADSNKCKPALYLKHHTIPTLYLCARKDEIIPNDHVICLYDKNPCVYKNMIEFDGTHNERRPGDVVERVFSFLCKHMNLDEDYETDSESSSDDAPTWKDPTSGNTVCKAMFKFLKQSEDESTRKRNALAGKSLLQSALFSSKPQSSKSPSHRLTLSNLEWLELLDKEDKEEEAYS